MFESADQKSDLIEIVRAIRESDPVVLEKIYREQYFKTEQLILNNNGTKDDAKDMYQQAFTILWRNVQQDKFVPESLFSIEAYLLKIVKYKWIDYLRSGHFKNQTDMMINIEVEQKEESLYDEEQENRLNLVKNKFKLLGKDCRKLLTSFYYKKYSFRAIAANMGWTEATARNNKYRCLEKLRSLITKNEL